MAGRANENAIEGGGFLFDDEYGGFGAVNHFLGHFGAETVEKTTDDMIAHHNHAVFAFFGFADDFVGRGSFADNQANIG